MSKQNEFTVGDIVRLKSGGPEMTVTQVRHPLDGVLEKLGQSPTVECMWFEGKSNKRGKGNFPPGSLEKVEKTGGAPLP